MYSCNYYPPQTTALYTFYVLSSLLVVVLAISLIWIPFVQLIQEVNTILVKMLIYMYREILGSENACFYSNIENLFLSQYTLIILAVSCILYLLYLASGDFLIFTGCYIYSLPNYKYLQKLKQICLGTIKYLLPYTRRKAFVFEDSTPPEPEE